MADIVNHTAENPNQRLYKTYEEALKSIRDFEIETTTKFVVWRKNKQFGCKGHKVVWHERAKDENDSGRHSIGYDGTPFFINGEVQHRDFSLHKKRRFHLQDTKKLDCPARIHMKDIVRFIDFKIQKETPHFRKEASKTIRSTIETGAEVKVERRIFVSYPSPEEHKFHPIGAEADIAQQVDTRNIDLIHLKISEGIRNVKEMKRHIKCYVKNYLFKDQSLPAPTNRRKYSDIKPDCDLYQQLGKLKDDADVTDYISIKLITSSNRLLLIYQSLWQKKLLRRHENELSMLDATYKTTRYSLPLFFLVVKTNTDYQVVASFVVQDEIQASIAEALQMTHQWCPQWKLRYFMVDKSDTEINAITRIFPECRVYLCDFHQEQVWERWLSLTEHGARNHQEEILCRLRRIATAMTSGMYQQTGSPYTPKARRLRMAEEAPLRRQQENGLHKELTTCDLQPVAQLLAPFHKESQTVPNDVQRRNLLLALLNPGNT
eukprot:gene11056-19914_t